MKGSENITISNTPARRITRNMYILFETPVSLDIFKIEDDTKLNDSEYIRNCFETADGTKKLLKLVSFEKFKDMEQALKVSTRLSEGKVSRKLKKLFKKCEEMPKVLGVAEPKIGSALHELFNIECVQNPVISEVMRAIREYYYQLVPDADPELNRSMTVGLAHNYSRHKLKFNPDKIDTMIVQSINLIDDVDKEINNYVMRCREWYSWHFPELARLISDNLTYVKAVKAIGYKNNAETTDFTNIVNESVAEEIKAAAAVSMGSEVTDEDMDKVTLLADHVVELVEYRANLMEYLVNRMRIVSPNLSLLVGEVVGARLIAHAGSLNNLAKQASSTIQVLGAEKALFNALKTRKNTPKYGLIFHAGLVTQASQQCKGRMSRTLAAKCSLAVRCDALTEGTMNLDRTIKIKAKLERHLTLMEQNSAKKAGSAGNKYQTQLQKTNLSGNTYQYNTAVDICLPKKRSFQKEENQDSPQDKISNM